ncbi:MAG: hypothetical protein WED04_07475 [Promethearchaeati archaeon SRVP18_Atabeyarchaeia-1]
MDFAIVTEKYPGGNIKTLRSTVNPITPELEQRALRLDSYLGSRIPAIEKELIDAGLLDEKIPKEGSFKNQGNISLWHALGLRLSALCDKEGVTSVRERRWLWEAIEKIYATERIKRIGRGRTRRHFEYCYQVSRYPIEFADQLNWAEWVYFFDSRTVREETRVHVWLMTRVKKGEKIDRSTFRVFTQHLNRRLRKLDTSVLNNEELFAIYDRIWQGVKTPGE